MTVLKPSCVAHIEFGAHLYGGAQEVLYLLGELSNTEFRSMLIWLERIARSDR